MPKITARAQQRRAEFELKVSLIKDLSAEQAAFVTALNTLIMMAHLQDAPERQVARWDAANEASNAWHVAAFRLTTVMEAYFPGSGLGKHLAQVSELLSLCFSMIYYVINPRDDRIYAPTQYSKLLQLSERLNLDVRELPKDAEEYLHAWTEPGPVGLMWAPLQSASNQAVSDLAQRVLNSQVVWSRRDLAHRN